jgi:hypothetical protein
MIFFKACEGGLGGVVATFWVLKFAIEVLGLKGKSKEGRMTRMIELKKS